MIHVCVGPITRSISTTSATIWAELSQACKVTLVAYVDELQRTNAVAPISTSVTTITVGGHYYIAAQLQELQAGTWYRYELHVDAQEGTPSLSTNEETLRDSFPAILCFRTLNEKQDTSAPLRIAYGSCRKGDEATPDALNAFGFWLKKHWDQREAQWPHLLLLIGDQIYADQPSESLQQEHPQLRDREGATTFEDFTHFYEHTWTKDAGVRQALAVLPTYMIFDDHEITGNWNTVSAWCAEMVRKGQEQVLVDGLVAYWIYQGWGNLDRTIDPQHSLLQQVMEEAAQSGEDAIEPLRTRIKSEVYGNADLRWHYIIPTTPSLFVTNVRSNRSAIFTDDPQAIYAPTHIMGTQQMTELQAWMEAQQNETGISILISSVPVLLPPVIGLAEYIAGIRLWQRSIAPLRWLGLQIARKQYRLALDYSFDHWPVFSTSWREFVQLLRKQRQDVLVLSGEVHFSYTAEARRTFAFRTKKRLYQFVCTPLQNVLGLKMLKLIVQQAVIRGLSFGGLHTHMLPLYHNDQKTRWQHDLLLQNSLAFLTLQTNGAGTYTLQQTYFGVVNGQLEMVAHTPPLQKP